MPPDTTERGLLNDLICIQQTGKSLSENRVFKKKIHVKGKLTKYLIRSFPLHSTNSSNSLLHACKFDRIKNI